MPTSGLTSAPSELGAFLSTFEQSRRRLRDLEAEAASSSAASSSLEAERTMQLRMLRESVSSCRMQLAELEREVKVTEARSGGEVVGDGGGGGGSDRHSSNGDDGGSSKSSLLRNSSFSTGGNGGNKANCTNGGGRGGGGGDPPPTSAEERELVRRVLDIDNRSFTVDGETVIDFEDPVGGLGAVGGRKARDFYSYHPKGPYRDDEDDGGGEEADGGRGDDFVNAARKIRTAWGRRDLQDITTRAATADELSALRASSSSSSSQPFASRPHNSSRPAEDGRSVDIVDESPHDDEEDIGVVYPKGFHHGRGDDWDSAAVGDFMERAWGRSSRSQRLRNLGRLCVMATAALAVVLFVGGMIYRFEGGDGGTGWAGDKSASSSVEGVDGDGNKSDHARLDAIRARIIGSGVTDERDLPHPPNYDPLSSSSSLSSASSSPQYRALHWIVQHDAMGLDVNDPFLLQRYALAVFYFSSNDDHSSSAQGNGSGNEDDRGFDSSRDKTNWLTMRGICAWRGVQCRHRPGTPPESTTYDDNGAVSRLELSRHRMSGPIVPELYRALTDLHVIDLSENALTGTLGTEIGRLTQLENLKLGKNGIAGTIPTEVGALTELKDLDLSENLLGGSIPEEIGGMTKLIGLGLFDNLLSGSIPSTLGKLTNLEVLYIDSNELTGPIPESFYSLKSLYDVRLRDNHLSGTISLAMGDMAKLKLLYLDSNELTGSIPTHLGLLGDLTQLHLFKNKLGGTLPHEVGGLAMLEHFSVNDNLLTGSIPEHFSSMTKVRDLYLYGNRLTGTIPRELGGDPEGSNDDYGMVNLADLRIFDNILSGPIPSQLGNLVHLEHLSLENNILTGAIPSEFGNLANLAKLRLDGNKLSGMVPPEVCHLTEDGGGVLVEFQSDCGGEEPKVECSCCTLCAEPGEGR